MTGRGYSDTESQAAWNRIQADAATPQLHMENLADAMFQHTATHAVQPGNRGVVWEGAVHHDATTGAVTIELRSSTRTGLIPDPTDYPSLQVPATSLDPGGRSQYACGMPNAAQAVANGANGGTPRSPAPPGVTFVTEGGIRLTGSGVLEYIPPCYNCGGNGYHLGTLDLNPHLRRLAPPDTVTQNLQPFAREVFRAPDHWGW